MLKNQIEQVKRIRESIIYGVAWTFLERFCMSLPIGIAKIEYENQIYYMLILKILYIVRGYRTSALFVSFCSFHLLFTQFSKQILNLNISKYV